MTRWMPSMKPASKEYELSLPSWKLACEPPSQSGKDEMKYVGSFARAKLGARRAATTARRTGTLRMSGSIRLTREGFLSELVADRLELRHQHVPTLPVGAVDGKRCAGDVRGV